MRGIVVTYGDLIARLGTTTGDRSSEAYGLHVLHAARPAHTASADRSTYRQEGIMQSPDRATPAPDQDTSGQTVLRAVPPLPPDQFGDRSASSDSPEYFDQQPTSTSSLPNPVPLMENLARCVLEVLAGARDLEQLSRWVADDVYRHLLKRVVLSTRARQARGTPPGRPSFRIGRTITCEQADGVVEGVVIIHGKARTRAVAIRLEGLDRRWRASAINVL